MNSWHSFSPNGKWLVFSSKAYSDYTQLCLTHIDRQGNSTPGILLEHFTAPDRAANIPEFVDAKPAAIKRISEEFLNDYSFVRAGNAFFKAGDTDNAIQEYKRALELNSNNTEAHLKLGFLMYNVKKMHEEGMIHYNKALQLDPSDPRIHHDLGMALLHQRQFDQATKHLLEALRRMPNGLDKQTLLWRFLMPESPKKRSLISPRSYALIRITLQLTTDWPWRLPTSETSTRVLNIAQRLYN